LLIYGPSNRIKKINCKSIRDNRLIVSHCRCLRNFIWLKKLCFWAQKSVILLGSCLVLWVLASHLIGFNVSYRRPQQTLEADKSKQLILNVLETKNHPSMLIEHQLKTEIIFLGEDDHQNLLIGLASSETINYCPPNKPFFLSFPEGYPTFSSQGPVEVVCCQLATDVISINVSISATKESFNFQKKVDLAALSSFLTFPNAFAQLETAKIYRPDLMQASTLVRACCRLVLPRKSEILDLQLGEFLAFKDGCWEKKLESTFLEAEVASISSTHVALRFFDRKQGISKLVYLPYSEEEDLAFSLADLIKDIKVRGEEIVVCKLGKQNCLLKKGDWLIKNHFYWKVINSSQDLERCISFELPGELLIFEGLEKKQGQLFCKGRLFSKMRTLSYPLEIPINGQGSQEEKKVTKTWRSRKNHTAAFEEKADREELLKLKGK
jgi:hypothetical protein